MKKIGIMFIMAGMLSFGLSSCGSDTEDPAAPKPTVDFKGGTGYVSTDQSKPAGDLIKFGINASGVENIERVQVLVSINGGSELIYADSNTKTLKTKNFSIDYNYTLGNVPGKEKITVKVTMANGEASSKSFTITVTAAARALQLRTPPVMGAQSNATDGSFFDLDNLDAKKQAEANANPALIDWIHYYGTSNKATLCSPDDATATTFFNGTVANWSKRKATRFAKNIFTTAEYDAMTTSADLDAKLASVNNKLVSDLKVGDVIVFINEGASKYGMIKITAVNASATGSITFEMKVPQL